MHIGKKKGSTCTTTYYEWDLVHQVLIGRVNENDYFHALLITLAIYTGLRFADMITMRWTDLLGKDKISLTEKKTKKRRVIDVHPFLKSMISRAYVGMNPSNDRHLCFRQKTNPYKHPDYCNMIKPVKALFKDYPQPGYSMAMNTFRKTFGRRVWEKNGESDASLLMLCEIFNHSDPAITRRYLGIRQEELGEIYINL